jgi:hypothetical protein
VNFWNFIPSPFRSRNRPGAMVGNKEQIKLRHILFGRGKKGKIKARQVGRNRGPNQKQPNGTCAEPGDCTGTGEET